MIRVITLVAVLTASAAPGSAQIRVGLRGGVTGTSTLVYDSIVEPITVRPGIAPSLGFWIDTELGAEWRFAATIGTAWSGLSRHSAGSPDRIVSLTLWSPTVSLSRRVGGPVIARVSAGAIAYDPDHGQGNLFAAGAPILPLVGLGLGVEREMVNSMRYAVELGYDLHWFTTGTLQAEGFSGQQAVHRLSLSISLSRVIRD